MSTLVVKRRNSSASTSAMQRTVDDARQLFGGSAVKHGVIDGYLTRASKVGVLRFATVLDQPVRLRFYGLLAGAPGAPGTSPAFTALPNRDSLLIPGTRLDPTQETARDEAVFPSALSYFVGGALTAGALPYTNSYTAYPGAAEDVVTYPVGHTVVDAAPGDDLSFYPLPDATQLWVEAAHYSRSDVGVRYVLSESLVAQITNGKRLFPRGLDSNASFDIYAVTWPRFPSALSDNRFVGCVPTVAQDSGSIVDYGKLHLLVLFSTLDEVDGAATTPFDVAFPDIPQFEQQLWDIAEPSYRPHFYEGNVLLTPEGNAIIYGKWLQRRQPQNTQLLPTRYRETRFRLRITPLGGQSWAVISCDVEGQDAATGDGGLRVNSEDGTMRVMTRPSVFLGAGLDWAVYVSYNVGINDIVNAPIFGVRANVSSTSLYVVAAGIEVAEGMPAGVTMLRGLPETITLHNMAFNTQQQQALACSHVNSGSVFGVTFCGFSDLDGSVVLCRWDNVNGFAVWEGFDLSELNVALADFVPAVTCYVMASVQTVDGVDEVVGTPAFTISGAFGGVAKTFVVVDGVAKLITEGGGLSAAVLGNRLQTTPLNKLYRR